MKSSVAKKDRLIARSALKLLPSIEASKAERYLGIDLLRGLAVVLMIFYHLIYDLIKFAKVPSFVGEWFWRIGPEIIAGTFLLTSGILCETLSRNEEFRNWKRVFKHGGRVFLYGLLLTIITLFFTERMAVVFGILHCIGLSIVIGTFFLKTSPIRLVLIALPILIVGWEFENDGHYHELARWIQLSLGGQRYTTDFFPMIPWFGYYLLGIAFSKTFFSRVFGGIKSNKSYLPILFMGRHSLWIYLIHQPVLFGVLYLFGFEFRM